MTLRASLSPPEYPGNKKRLSLLHEEDPMVSPLTGYPSLPEDDEAILAPMWLVWRQLDSQWPGLYQGCWWTIHENIPAGIHSLFLALDFLARSLNHLHLAINHNPLYPQKKNIIGLQKSWPRWQPPIALTPIQIVSSQAHRPSQENSWSHSSLGCSSCHASANLLRGRLLRRAQLGLQRRDWPTLRCSWLSGQRILKLPLGTPKLCFRHSTWFLHDLLHFYSLKQFGVRIRFIQKHACCYFVCCCYCCKKWGEI